MPWVLDGLMDLAKVPYQLRVESFSIIGTKTNTTDAPRPLNLIVNVENLGESRYTYDSANKGITSACASVTGTQEELHLLRNWDIPLSAIPTSFVRIWLSDIATPRTIGAATLTALTSSFAWHAVLALTPCDSDIN
jgi:hypothetical protein